MYIIMYNLDLIIDYYIMCICILSFIVYIYKYYIICYKYKHHTHIQYIHTFLIFGKNLLKHYNESVF